MPRRAAPVELALVVLAMLVLSGGPSALYVKAFNYAPPLPEKIVVAPVLLLMLLHMVLRLKETVIGALASFAWLFLALLALASYKWSISPSDTFREAAVMLIVVPWLGMMAAIADWRDLVGRIWWACVILLGFSVILYVAVPALGRMQEIYEGAFVGLWHEKNATGQFLCMTAIASLARAALRPRAIVSSLAVFAISAGLLIPAQSATALIATVLATLVFVWIILMRRHFMVAIPGFVLTILLAAPVGWLAVSSGQEVLGALGKSGTLTGRVPIWDALRDYALSQRTRFGHGYEAFWSDAYAFGQREFVFDQLGFEAQHAHNSFIEMRLALGWAGTLPWLLAAAQGIVFTLARIRTSNGVYFALPFIVAAIPIALVEVPLTSLAQLPGVFFVLVVAKMTLAPSPVDRESSAKGTLEALVSRAHPQPRFA